ncbi:MAG TPA: cation transporter, partial [Spirochaetota bacterium]|nr:cation transporter [Spirochaetota bacterium]
MKKTSIVVGITLITMIAEIAYGLITGSMALLADGIHMGTHTFALTITVIAYYIAIRHARNPNFAFSSGKVGVLGGFTSAIVL